MRVTVHAATTTAAAAVAIARATVIVRRLGRARAGTYRTGADGTVRRPRHAAARRYRVDSRRARHRSAASRRRSRAR